MCITKKLLLLGLCHQLLAPSALSQEGNWTHIGQAGLDANVYVSDASIKAHDGNYRVVVELINYVDADRHERSLLSGSIYDCDSPRKLDQFVSEYSLHWGLGARSSSSSIEERWFYLKPRSIGAAVQAYVCQKDLKSIPAT